ncbi:methyl-accepting chemotaxis protein [Schinkia sp. CFF1]
MQKRYKFGLRLKVVVFITIVSIITYSTTGIFIYFLNDYVKNFIPISEEFLTVLSLVMGIVWSGIIAYFVAGLLSKPLQVLEEAVHKAAEGDIREDVKVSKSDDEIRALGLAFNNMLQSLRTMVYNIEQNFQNTNDHVDHISEASSTAAIQAETISKTLEEIASGAERSACAVTGTVESINTVTVISQEVLKHASDSQEVSANMVVSLENSKKVIHSLVEGIEKLAKDNQSSLSAVQRLEKNAKEINNIISLVGDIAGQTNLLALNASIEAARAGEHGKGFAVVAEEVRQLADQSRQAVQGISKLVENIQEEVKSVVSQIHEQVDAANKSAEKGNETNVAIQQMTESVQQMEEAVHQIAIFAEKQMKHIQDTSTQSEEVAAIAEQTSAGSEEIAATTVEQAAQIDDIAKIAGQLSEQARNLKQTINQFRLGGK